MIFELKVCYSVLQYGVDGFSIFSLYIRLFTIIWKILIKIKSNK